MKCTNGETARRIGWLATSVTSTRARSAARKRISLMTVGQASASTQICTSRALRSRAASRLLLPLGGALLFQGLLRFLLRLFLAIHTLAHVRCSRPHDRMVVVAKIAQRERGL